MIEDDLFKLRKNVITTCITTCEDNTIYIIDVCRYKTNLGVDTTDRNGYILPLHTRFVLKYIDNDARPAIKKKLLYLKAYD